jgi:3-carboxy-cis,cis-muconate cycloisomerase
MWLDSLFSDSAIAELLAAPAQLEHMLRIESAYSQALAASGMVEHQLAEQVLEAIAGFEADWDALTLATARDGVVVPELVRQIRAKLADSAAKALHRGLTSQDIIDTALILTLREANAVLSERLTLLRDALAELSRTHGHRQLMGRTRMQAAVPITVADRIATWLAPMADHHDRLTQLRPRLERLQFGGAAGNRDVLGDQGGAIAERFAATLELGNPDKAWHAMRDSIAEYAAWLSLVAGSTAKMGQDICLMAQQGFDEIEMTGGGGSSAMAHKHNPIKAELLVTLGRFNAVQISGIHHALVHEQERSGAAWMLEWMLLPQMLMVSAKALVVAGDVVRSVVSVGGVE